MIHVVCAPNAVCSIICELTDQTNQALVNVELSEKLEQESIEVPVWSSAVVIVLNNVELHIIVKEGASDWPYIKEEMKSEVAEIEG